MKSLQSKQINHWFQVYIADYTPDDLVQACENCAHFYNHDEWLDDPEHEVWEIGAEWFERFWS